MVFCEFSTLSLAHSEAIGIILGYKPGQGSPELGTAHTSDSRSFRDPIHVLPAVLIRPHVHRRNGPEEIVGG